jgi:hypothetical protein
MVEILDANYVHTAKNNKTLNITICYTESAVDLNSIPWLKEIYDNTVKSHNETIERTEILYNNEIMAPFQYNKLRRVDPDIDKKVTKRTVMKTITVIDDNPPMNSNGYKIYLIDNAEKKIMCYVSGVIHKDESKHTFINNQEMDYMYVALVETFKDYQGLGLCKLALQNFINATNFDYYGLDNVGGIAGCRCYFSAFTELNYNVYDKYNAPIDISSICKTDNDANIHMYFVRAQRGGSNYYHKYLKYRTKYLHIINL